MPEISQDSFDAVTQYFRDYAEEVSQAATKAASKLKEAGWEISLTDPDPYDMGLATGIVFGVLVRGLHEHDEVDELEDDDDTLGDLSGI